MKAQKPHGSMATQFSPVAPLTALPWPVIDAWHRGPKEEAAVTPVPLPAEERYRMTEFVAQRQVSLRRVAPESVLRGWLDAGNEVKPH